MTDSPDDWDYQRNPDAPRYCDICDEEIDDGDEFDCPECGKTTCYRCVEGVGCNGPVGEIDEPVCWACAERFANAVWAE